MTRGRFLTTLAAATLAAGATGKTEAFAAAAAESGLSADTVALAKPPPVVRFDPADVRLHPGLFQNAMARDTAYLLHLDPDRFLSKFRTNAGLPPKGAPYGGWESQGIAGHTFGHYLSACARAYRDTGDDQFLTRTRYMVDEIAACQARNPKGLATAIPDPVATFDGLKGRGGKMIGWVPWYTMHKLFAGLHDAYRSTGYAPAKTAFLRLSDWAGMVTDPLTPAEMEKMLQVEHGGMAETLADAYALSGDPRHLATARRFCHKAVMDPLSQGDDHRLTGLHANTQIPKIIGAGRLYEITGEPYFRQVAETFWQSVTTKRTYVIGGNSDDEHFFAPGKFDAHLTNTTCETCNTYNMLKLTAQEFGQNPSARYMDFYERALINHILASQDPENGMFTYFVPLGPGRFKTYSDPTEAMWCCVGTGMENHTRYNEAIYARSHAPSAVPALFVNLFMASEVTWRKADNGGKSDIVLHQETRFPEEAATRLTIATCETPTRFALRVRQPAWIAGSLNLQVNGKAEKADLSGDGYVTVTREWKRGDTVDILLPMTLHTESLPGSDKWQALLYGPVVLAAAMGTGGLEAIDWKKGEHDQNQYRNLPTPPAPIVLGNASDLVAHTVAITDGPPLHFRAAPTLAKEDGKPSPAIGSDGALTFLPFYQMYRQRYAVYVPVYSPEEWEAQRAVLQATEAHTAELLAQTIDAVDTGAQQSDVDHNLQSDRSSNGDLQGRRWRDAQNGGWFAYDVHVPTTDTHTPLTLLCTYWGGDGDNRGSRSFTISVNGTVIATETLTAARPGKFYNVAYPIPEALTKGKTTLTVRFDARPGAMAGGVFGFRLLRSQYFGQIVT